jgi:uncharacterized membrane protein
MTNYAWLIYPACAALSLAAADFFLKLASSRMSSNLVAFVYSLATLVIPTIIFLWARARGEEIRYTPTGFVFAVLMGFVFSLVVVFINLTFANGVNLSVGTPIIRFAGIVLASALGILVFGETISVRYVIGFIFVLMGLYFIVTR